MKPKDKISRYEKNNAELARVKKTTKTTSAQQVNIRSI